MSEIVSVNTYPFGKYNSIPYDTLYNTGWDIRHNPLEGKAKVNEVLECIKKDVTGVIAGTEPYNREIISQCPNLKVISRVGVGFDNVDLQACKDYGVIATYTPEAPSDSVAELTIGQIINLLRGVYMSDKYIRNGEWNRNIGFLLREIKIGVLGVGRIGGRVVKFLKDFGCHVYCCDISPEKTVGDKYGVTWLSKAELFSECNLVTIHIPLDEDNINLITQDDFKTMPSGSYFINTSRGGIVNEEDLYTFLENGHLAGANLDVYSKEPYTGKLKNLDNIILTSHIGSCSRQGRFLMEMGAVEDCIRVLKGQEPKNRILI